MKKLVFASNNAHKLEEVRALFSGRLEVVSLADIGCHEEIPETADTLEAMPSSRRATCGSATGSYCFADDTGLEVEALDGAPGVYSARFAGEHATFEENVALLLERLKGVPAPRRACFRTVIALIDEYGTHFFEGAVNGEITLERSGDHGFGYDPIFGPEGCQQTFAELSSEEKNAMSHRGRAVQRLARYLHALPLDE